MLHDLWLFGHARRARDKRAVPGSLSKMETNNTSIAAMVGLAAAGLVGLYLWERAEANAYEREALSDNEKYRRYLQEEAARRERDRVEAIRELTAAAEKDRLAESAIKIRRRHAKRLETGHYDWDV